MIKIKNLNKYYNKGKSNEIHVINDTSLELPNVGLISFLGPSGSGKTTLLNVIGGLDKATGIISYDDNVIHNYNMHKVDKFRSKEIGYVFQNYNLLLQETVYRNLAIALEMIGIYDLEEQERRIEYTLKAVGMYKYRKKRAYALSGGQQQRVSIARALVKKSKIIIADEPTGNLDSDNTIEVMNILKKISKTSLVLLVTHNEEVANFYSDQVIMLKDGQIIESYTTEKHTSLSLTMDNKIYLKDLEQTSLDDEKIAVQVYGLPKEENLQLDVIYKNGTFYLRSNQKIKLAEESNIEILNEKYKHLNQTHLDDFSYDTSWFKETEVKRNIFVRLGSLIAQSFNKIRFGKKRTKVLYVGYFIIGILLGLCVIGYSNFSSVDDTEIIADSNYSELYSNSFIPYNTQYSFIHLNMIDGNISSAATPISSFARIRKVINYNESMDYVFPLTFISALDNKNLRLEHGKFPNKGEIGLSRKYADEIINQYGYFYPNYESLMGISIDIKLKRENTNFPVSLTISGIVDTSTNLSYVCEEDYMSCFSYLDRISHPTSMMPDITWRNYLNETEYGSVYTIVKGRDLNEDDRATLNILMPTTFENAETYLDNTLSVKRSKYDSDKGQMVVEVVETYNVVGLYELKDMETPSNEFISYSFTDYNKFVFADSYETYDWNDYRIIKGRKAEKYDECIVSIYSKYEIGDNIKNELGNTGVKVVGKYYGSYLTMQYFVLYHRDYVVAKAADTCWFKIVNQKKLKTVLDGSLQPYFPDAEITNSYESAIAPLLEEHRTEQLVFGLASIASFVVLGIFIYFMMRSRMISDVSNIGIYRSLGMSKGKFIISNLVDIIVSITITSLIGFLITIGIFNSIAASLKNTILISVAKHCTPYIGLGILALYGLNIIFGLLPIYLLLRKTPAEIISKYDI